MLLLTDFQDLKVMDFLFKIPGILLETGRFSNLQKIETQAISLLVNACSITTPLVKTVDFEEKLNFEIDSFRGRI